MLVIVLVGVDIRGNEAFEEVEDAGGDPEALEEAYEGAATAVEGSLSAPTPHGI